MSTGVYTGGVDYRFDDDVFQRLGAAGLSWQDAIDVLQARPRYQRHVGAVLYIGGTDRRGRWIGLVLIEEQDDTYLVVSGRLLDNDEAGTIKRLLEGGAP